MNRIFCFISCACFLLCCTGCSHTDNDHGLPSPCVGIEGSPCVTRPVNAKYYYMIT